MNSFVRTGHQSVELAEVGPRLTMRLFEIRGGCLDNKVRQSGSLEVADINLWYRMET